jgi:hypothetical protein
MHEKRNSGDIHEIISFNKKRLEASGTRLQVKEFYLNL